MFLKDRASHKPLLVLFAIGAALALVSCAPQGGGDGDSSQANRPNENTVDFTWTPEVDCSGCHENDVESFDDPLCVASKHADMKSQCLSCHNDEAGLEKAHAKVSLDSVKKKATLKKTDVSESICLTCHDKAELAVATAGSAVLTDSNGLVVNPHDIPANDDHAKAEIACASCHKVHGTQGSEEVAPGVCLNCHHHDVYECNTCHT